MSFSSYFLLIIKQCVSVIAAGKGKAEGTFLADSYHAFPSLQNTRFHWLCGIEDNIP